VEEGGGAAEGVGDGSAAAGGVVFEGDEQFVEVAAGRAGRQEAADAVVEEGEGHAVVFGDDQPGEAGGEERGVFEFGEAVGGFREAHGGGAIEEEVAFEVGFLLEGAEEQLVIAGEDPPIDLGEVVAGNVLAELVELDGGAALAGAVAAGKVAFDHRLGAELIVLEAADVLGLEVAVGEHGWRS